LATQTQVRKTKPRNRSQRVGKTATIRHTTTPKKPKTFKQWAGQRGSKWMGRHWSTRAVRGLYRFGRREADGIRRRRADTKANRPHSMPSRRAMLARKMARARAKARTGFRKIALADQHTHCLGCGQNFRNIRGYNEHACAQNHGTKAKAPVPKVQSPTAPAAPKPAAKPKVKASKPASNGGTAAAAAGGAALGAAMAAAAKGKIDHSNHPAQPAAPAAEEKPPMGPMAAKAHARARGRQWRQENKARRKQDMKWHERARDRAGREAGAAVGRNAKCVQCGWKIRPGEQHDCQGRRSNAKTGPDPAAGAQSPPAAPAKAPAPAKTPAPAPSKPVAVPKPANGGGATGKGAAMTAPATTNGSAPTPSGNSSGGPGPGLAAALVQAWGAWCQDIPEFHDDMIVKMNATREAMGQIATMLQDHAAQLVAAEFHPECVTPLLSASAQTLETANHFTNVLMAIERVYGPLLNHYRSGIPDPGEKYLSSGRKGS
jgi:hypothetical protein